jgi:hypothetical protein
MGNGKIHMSEDISANLVVRKGIASMSARYVQGKPSYFANIYENRFQTLLMRWIGSLQKHTITDYMTEH